MIDVIEVMTLLVPAKKATPKNSELSMELAGEVTENYVSLNVGKVIDLWLSLVKALSSLRRNTNGDAETGLEVLQLLGKELASANDNEMPNDEVARYVVRRLTEHYPSAKELQTQIDTAT